MPTFVKAHMQAGHAVKGYNRRSVIRAYTNSKFSVQRLEKGVRNNTTPIAVLERSEKNLAAARSELLVKYNRSRKFRGQPEVSHVPRSITYKLSGGKNASDKLTRHNTKAVMGLMFGRR